MRYCQLFVLVLCTRFTPILTQECTTPNGVLSECKLFEDCTPLITYLEKRPIAIRSESEKNYLRSLECPTNNIDDMQYVCCASDDQFYRVHLENTSTTTHAPITMMTVTTTHAPITMMTITTTQVPITIMTTTTTPNVAEKNGIGNDDLDFPDPSNNECGIDSLTEKIVGGVETEIGEYSWMALLEYENRKSKKRSFKCGGSLIHRRFVLTAAHCIIGSYLKKYGRLVNVRLGEHNITATNNCQTANCTDSVVNVGVEYAQAHPRYTITNSSMDNDIGIIRLDRDIETTAHIQPICFPPSDIDSPDGMVLTVSGWGGTRLSEASDVKRRVGVPIVNYTRCQTKLSHIAIDNDKQICAGGQYAKSSCYGDSGGPLMRFKDGLWYLEGIISFSSSFQCGDHDVPEIFTRVNAFRDWVLDYIQYM